MTGSNKIENQKENCKEFDCLAEIKNGREQRDDSFRHFWNCRDQTYDKEKKDREIEGGGRQEPVFPPNPKSCYPGQNQHRDHDVFHTNVNEPHSG